MGPLIQHSQYTIKISPLGNSCNSIATNPKMASLMQHLWHVIRVGPSVFSSIPLRKTLKWDQWYENIYTTSHTCYQTWSKGTLCYTIMTNPKMGPAIQHSWYTIKIFFDALEDFYSWNYLTLDVRIPTHWSDIFGPHHTPFYMEQVGSISNFPKFFTFP